MKKFKQILFFTILINFHFLTNAQETVTINGYVKDSQTKEDLIGAIIHVKGITKGVSTNDYGFYSIKVPVNDTIEVNINSLGFEQYSEKFFTGSQNFKKDFLLIQQNISTQEIVVKAKNSASNTENTQMSNTVISIEQAKKIPAFMGEVDIVKVLQMKPGIQSGGEGVTGIFVRGGGADQNLILLDEANVYNANHLFGFFSIFNPDIVKGAELYKGAFPAQYGGRLSSVIDVKLKEGNKKKFGASGGIGLISTRLTLEGPIQKGKSSFIISGRRTYVEPLINWVNNSNKGKPDFTPIPGYYFYDINAKANYEIGKNDKLFAGLYIGRDAFSYRDRSSFDFIWGNTVGSLRWNHVFGSKLFCNTSLYTSNYQYILKQQFENYHFQLGSEINDIAIKSDFEYFTNNKHEIKFGAYFTYHQFNIGQLQAGSTDNTVNFKGGTLLNAQDFGVYLGDEFEISNKLKANAGLRLSGFRRDNGGNEYFIIPEPRLSLRYKIKENISIKGSYTRMMQYTHLVSNSGGTLPTDVWYPSNKNVNPESAHQAAFGLSSNHKDGMYSLSYECYYKKMSNQIDLKDGAQIFSNPNLESEFVFGKGWAYGNEFSIEKKKGKLTGWIGYTLAWNWRQFNEINSGKAFHPRSDQRHNINTVAVYEVSKRFSISLSFVYGSGSAVTLPKGRFLIQNIPGGFPHVAVPEYMPRNSYRMAPYNRMDIAFIWKFAPKWGESDLTFAIYNLYNRLNPYFIYFEPEIKGDKTNLNFVAKQASLFPVIPSITYNFKF